MILLLWLLWARKVTKIVKINKEKLFFYVLDPKKGLKIKNSTKYLQNNLFKSHKDNFSKFSIDVAKN